MTSTNNRPSSKFNENDYIEFYDYRKSTTNPHRKVYEGLITSVIYSDTNTFNQYTYVIENENITLLPLLDQGKSSIQVYESHIIGTTEPFNVAFLKKYGWFKSTNPEHPDNFYVKNKYPLGFLIDEQGIWCYDARSYKPNSPFITEPIATAREYNHLIQPILDELNRL